MGDVFRGLIPVAGYYRGDVGLLLFTNDAVFPLRVTEIFVISSAEGQMFLLMEKVETSEGLNGYVLKDKVCSPLKTVEYMTCPLLYIEGSCVFNADKKNANWFCTAGYEKSVH